MRRKELLKIADGDQHATAGAHLNNRESVDVNPASDRAPRHAFARSGLCKGDVVRRSVWLVIEPVHDETSGGGIKKTTHPRGAFEKLKLTDGRFSGGRLDR